MNDRILETYLDAGLIELNGNDTWFTYITSAADDLARYIAENPRELSSFVYSAINPASRADDPAQKIVLSTIKKVWRTYSSVTMGSPETILKAIILDAVFSNAERDPQVKLAVALLLSSALPHIDLGAEAKVLQPLLEELIEDVENSAEARWSVPKNVQLPSMEAIKPILLKAAITGYKVDSESLLKGLAASAGPQDADGNVTNGNPHWTNQAAHWSKEFAPRAAEAIETAINEGSSKKQVTIKTDPLLEEIGDLVETYIKTISERLTSASYGVELRSRLLWWKEAMVSPSARVEYQSLSPMVSSALMAFDFQSMLPPLAPASVVAFLRATVRSRSSENDESVLSDLLTEFASSEALKSYRLEHRIEWDELSILPFSSLILRGISGADEIKKMTLFDPEKSISSLELSVLMFTELQACKAVNEIVAKDAESVDGGEHLEIDS